MCMSRCLLILLKPCRSYLCDTVRMVCRRDFVRQWQSHAAPGKGSCCFAHHVKCIREVLIYSLCVRVCVAGSSGLV